MEISESIYKSFKNNRNEGVFTHPLLAFSIKNANSKHFQGNSNYSIGFALKNNGTRKSILKRVYLALFSVFPCDCNLEHFSRLVFVIEDCQK